MACNCKHHEAEIAAEKESVAMLRELFIRRMTVDSETQDRRKKDYNQAIFDYYDNGGTFACFSDMDMDMVLRCFDDAVNDLRRTWCDVEGCRRK